MVYENAQLMIKATFNGSLMIMASALEVIDYKDSIDIIINGFNNNVIH
jgi:hypothetical protein